MVRSIRRGAHRLQKFYRQLLVERLENRVAPAFITLQNVPTWQFQGPGPVTGSDGDTNGVPGGDQTVQAFRLFGDADGNGPITASDFNSFRLVYGSVGPSIFDFNGDNTITAADCNAFRLRYGTSI